MAKSAESSPILKKGGVVDKKKSLLALVCVVLLVTLVACNKKTAMPFSSVITAVTNTPTPCPSNTVSFTTVYGGPPTGAPCPGCPTRENLVFTSQADYASYLAANPCYAASPCPSVPAPSAINFATETLIIVNMGMFTGSPFATEISSIEVDCNQAKVKISEYYSCGLLTALCYPRHWVTVSKGDVPTGLPVVFEYLDVDSDGDGVSDREEYWVTHTPWRVCN